MKKLVLGYIFLFLITVLFVGCAGTTIIQEPDIRLDIIEDVKTTYEACTNTEAPEVSRTPQIAPIVTTSVTMFPEWMPESTLKEFGVDDVIMQSTSDSSCLGDMTRNGKLWS